MKRKNVLLSTSFFDPHGEERMWNMRVSNHEARGVELKTLPQGERV